MGKLRRLTDLVGITRPAGEGSLPTWAYVLLLVINIAIIVYLLVGGYNLWLVLFLIALAIALIAVLMVRRRSQVAKDRRDT